MLKYLSFAAGLLVVLSAPLYGSNAAAQDSDATTAGVTYKAPEIAREPLKYVPPAVPSSDPRVNEKMTINTAALHGVSPADVQRAGAVHAAAMAGATLASDHTSDGSYGEYRIGAGDLIEVLVFNDVTKTLNREITVRYDGQVSLPRVPDLQIGGLTRNEAEQAMVRAYAQVYREPELSLTVLDAKSKTYSVIGDVDRPGSYPYIKATTLTEALTISGGIARRSIGGGSGGSGNSFVGAGGMITQAFVVRNLNGQREVISHDLFRLQQARHPPRRHRNLLRRRRLRTHRRKSHLRPRRNARSPRRPDADRTHTATGPIPRRRFRPQHRKAKRGRTPARSRRG